MRFLFKPMYNEQSGVRLWYKQNNGLCAENKTLF